MTTRKNFTERVCFFTETETLGWVDSQTVPQVNFNRSSVIRSLLEVCKRRGITVTPLGNDS